MGRRLLLPYLVVAIALAPMAGCREVGKFASKEIVTRNAARQAGRQTVRETEKQIGEGMPLKRLTGLLDQLPAFAEAPVPPNAPLARLAAPPPRTCPEGRSRAVEVDVPVVVSEPEALYQRRQREHRVQWEMELRRQQQLLERHQTPYDPYASHPR